MTTSGTIDAAAAARREEQQLTEIAQITPGHTAKARELLVNRDVPSSLLPVFEAAVQNESYADHLQAFNVQQQQKTELQQQQAEAKREKAKRDEWLDSMSPEYRQAYDHLMTTVDNADKAYDRMRGRLAERRDALDRDARDIDDNALHLADGKRAYVDGRGRLVDKNGVPLNGQEAAEAKQLAAQRGGMVTNLSAYQQNEQDRADNDRRAQRVDQEEKQANDFGDKVRGHQVPDTKEVQQGDAEIQKQLSETQRQYDQKFSQPVQQVNKVSMADLSDFDGAATPAATTARPDHASYASQIAPDAGIKAGSLATPFNAATQSPPAAATGPAQKPTPTVVPAP